MTTSELIAQDEDVTDAEMQIQIMKKTKRPDGSDSKDEEKKKKKKKKHKEHKAQKDEQKEEIESNTEPQVKKEEIESETEPFEKKDEEMQKKKEAKLSDGIDENNCKGGPDGGKEKKKKKKKTEDFRESSPHITKEQKGKRTKHVEGGSLEKLHEGESSSHITKEKKRKKTKHVEGGSLEKIHEGESKHVEGGSLEKFHEGESSSHITEEKKRKKTKLVESGSLEKIHEGESKHVEGGSLEKFHEGESSSHITKEKKRKKTKLVESGSLEKIHEGESKHVEGGSLEKFHEGESSSHSTKEKKRKKTKLVESGSLEKIHEGESKHVEGGSLEKFHEGESSSHITKEKKRKKTKLVEGGSLEKLHEGENSSHITKEKKRKKTKHVEGGSLEKLHEGGAGLGENEEISCPPEKLSPKGSSKKVRFSEDVEIFPLVDAQSSGKTKEDDGLVRGKRFSKEEDEIVKKAVLQYIEQHALGEEGLKKVLRCREFPEVKNCWKDIGKAIPYRPYLSVYYRAHILFERDETRKWTPEEYDFVREFHDKHGADWKSLAEVLGKHRFHVKDTWRRIKLPNMKKGHWTQDEYQKLFDLVNKDLRLKASEEKKSKHGMLRDNICWGAISDKLSTRSTALCCMKWYRQLTSTMVATDEWADIDDYRLVDALSSVDACSVEDVEWDKLLEHRNGDVCRKRWTQMVKHIGDNGNKSFSEQVEVLSERYSLDVLDAREAYANAPIVD